MRGSQRVERLLHLRLHAPVQLRRVGLEHQVLDAAAELRAHLALARARAEDDRDACSIASSPATNANAPVASGDDRKRPAAAEEAGIALSHR